MLVGSKFEYEEKAGDMTVFLISDFGWSVFLSAIGDDDPSTVNPELTCTKQGVPANASTGERRYRIRDSSDGNWDDAPTSGIVDRGRPVSLVTFYVLAIAWSITGSGVTISS